MSGRNEDILRSMIDGTSYTKEPKSRNEELLLELKDVIEAGGGGSADAYTKSETDTLLTAKADKVTTYTKSETDAKITEKVAEIVADAPEDFDTLKEMSDWIAGHEDSAAAMNSAIQANTLAITGKVDKATGKGLSTEDYTTAEKTKLSGIEAGANNITVDSALSSSSTNPVQNKVINSALSNKIPKNGDTSLSGTFEPQQNYGANLGSSSYRFDKIYGKDLYLTNALSVPNGGTGCTTLSDFKTALGFGNSAYKGYTTSVTSGSTDLITSGAVYSGLAGKADQSTTYTKTEVDSKSSLAVPEVTGSILDYANSLSAGVHFCRQGTSTGSGKPEANSRFVYMIMVYTSATATIAGFSGQNQATPCMYMCNKTSNVWGEWLKIDSESANYIPLVGSSAITGNLVPSTSDSIDLGSSSKRWNNSYVKKIDVESFSMNVRTIDCDATMESGHYIFYGNGRTSNLPSTAGDSEYGILVVYRSGDYCIQIVFMLGKKTAHIRFTTNVNSNPFTSWVQIFQFSS